MSDNLKIVLVPSREWYSSNWFTKEFGSDVKTELDGIVSNLNILSKAGLKIEALLDTEVLKTPIKANFLFIEVLLVAPPESKLAFKFIDRGEDPSDPDLYNLRVVLDGSNLKQSALDVLWTIIDTLLFTSRTFISTRTVVGAGERLETASTPFPVGFYEAVSRGVPKDGGLYMPRSLPKFTNAELAYLVSPHDSVGKKPFERTMQFVLEKLIGVPESLTLSKSGALSLTPFSDSIQDNKDRLFVAEGELDDEDIQEITNEINESVQEEINKSIESNKNFADKISSACSDLPEFIRAKIAERLQHKCVDRYGVRELPHPREIAELIAKAYDPERGFGKKGITFGKLLPSNDSDYFPPETDEMGMAIAAAKDVRFMELCKGPTGCYEDYSFQLFSQFYSNDSKYMVVMATNGDAGVAAIEAFIRNGPKTTQLFILYPQNGITGSQLLHIHSYADGVRIHAIGVKETFDFCQRTACKIMRDKAVIAKAAGAKKSLTLANACNWGRIIPMIGVYAHSYVECSVNGDKDKRRVRHPLDAEDHKKRNDLPNAFDVVIPAGNLGNLVAAYAAKKMGIPIRTIVVVTNENDVMHEFLTYGTFDNASRFPKSCQANALDVITANNLERLLYLLHDETELKPIERIVELSEGDKKDMMKDREKKPSLWKARDEIAADQAKVAEERAARIAAETGPNELAKTNIVRKLMVDLQVKRRFTVSDFIFTERIKTVFCAVRSNCTMAKEAMRVMYLGSSKSRLPDPLTALSISALDTYYRRVKKEQDAWEFDRKNKEDFEPLKRQYTPIFPIVLQASSHWSCYPQVCMRAIKAPLLTHDDVDMPTPPGFEEPATCCRKPLPPRAPEPIQDIVKRQVMTMIKRTGSVDNKFSPQVKSLLIPKKRYSDKFVIVEGTYDAIVKQLTTFIPVDNEQYITSPTSEEKKKKDKEESRAKAAAENALKREYVKQEDLDAWKPTAVPPSVLGEEPKKDAVKLRDRLKLRAAFTFDLYRTVVTPESSEPPVVEQSAIDAAIAAADKECGAEGPLPTADIEPAVAANEPTAE